VYQLGYATALLMAEGFLFPAELFLAGCDKHLSALNALIFSYSNIKCSFQK